MLVTVYVFALVLGAVLLGASILLGGQDGDAEGGDAIVSPVEGGFDVFWAFRSFRFWTFFLAFFGLTGLVLDGLGLLENSLLALGLSLGLGAGAGFLAAFVLRWLGRDTTGSAAESLEYVGKSVRVLVPVRKGSVGKVRLELRGQVVDVLATTDEEEAIGVRDEAVIIEMEGTTARIARLEMKPRALHPGETEH